MAASEIMIRSWYLLGTGSVESPVQVPMQSMSELMCSRHQTLIENGRIRFPDSSFMEAAYRAFSLLNIHTKHWSNDSLTEQCKINIF